jgi:hypothetical protein
MKRNILLLFLLSLSAGLRVWADGTTDAGFSGSADTLIITKDNVLKKYIGAGDTVVIPNGVAIIGAGAFADCRNLKSVIIPSSVTAIEYGAFQNCTALTGITLPKSVSAVGNSIFLGCSKLEAVYINNLIPPQYSAPEPFYFVNKATCPVYVKKGARGNYQVADGWKSIVDEVIFEQEGELEDKVLLFNVGEVQSLPLTVYPATVYPATVYLAKNTTQFWWISSNPAVVAVSDDGVATAKSSGIATVYIVNERGHVAACDIYVQGEIPGLIKYKIIEVPDTVKVKVYDTLKVQLPDTVYVPVYKDSIVTVIKELVNIIIKDSIEYNIIKKDSIDYTLVPDKVYILQGSTDTELIIDPGITCIQYGNTVEFSGLKPYQWVYIYTVSGEKVQAAWTKETGVCTVEGLSDGFYIVVQGNRYGKFYRNAL